MLARLPTLREWPAPERAVADRSPDKEALQLVALAALAVGCTAILLLAGGHAAAGTDSMAWSWMSFWSGLGLLTMVAAASFATGGLAGFVFGIPRVPDGRDAVASGERTSRAANGSVALNSNLGQVSDWLTKILLGAGLTQITRIGEMLHQIALVITDKTTVPVSFVPALLVYFVTLGFLAVYIWTITRFAGMVNDAVNTLLSEVNAKADQVLGKVEALESGVADSKKVWELLENQLNLENRERDRPVEEFVRAFEPLEGRERAMIFYHTRRVRHDNWERNKKRMARTVPIFQALIAVDHEQNYHRNHAQLGYCYKDQQHPDYAKAIEHLDKAIEIRMKRQINGWTIYEFNRALCRIELALQGKGASPADVQNAILEDLNAATQYDDCGSILAGPGSKPIDGLRQHPRIRLWCQRNADRIRQSSFAGILKPSPALSAVEPAVEVSS